MPFQTSFTATLLVINKGTVAQDVTVKYWLMGANETTYGNGTSTIFVNAGENKTLDVQILTPTQDGTYTLFAQTTVPVVVHAETTLYVQTIPIWDIIIIISIVVVAVIFIYYKRHS